MARLAEPKSAMDKRGKNAHLHGAKNDISRSPSARQFGVSAGTGAPHAPGRLAGPAKVPRSSGQVVPRR